jgi:hypothetical protein
MNNDLPPWKEDPNNPTRKPGEKRKDKYGNEIKNVARHLARKAMNSIKEASKKSRKKDWTGAKVDKDRFILPEEIDLDEAATSDNILHGYHGNVAVKDDSERAKKFSAMHTKVKKLAHAAGHLSDAKKPNVMVKHFLDSAHGRHIASDDSETNIKSRFKHFAKSYDPAMHEEVELEEKRGLWDNIHAKRKRIKAGSGERMRKPGSEGAPTAAALKASNEEVEHENCGTPECCGQCDTAEVAEESGKSKQYIEITHVLGQKKRVPVHPLNAYKALNHYRNDPTTKSARIVSEEQDIEEAYGMWKVDFPKQHAGKAVAAGSVHVKAQNTAHAHKVAAKRVGVDHKAFKSKVTKSSVLPEDVDSFADALIKRNKQNLNKGHVVNAARIAGMDGKKLMSAVNKKVGRIKEETEGKVYSVHVKGDSEQHNSPEFKKHLAGWGGEHHYTSDKGAAYKFKKEYQATGFHHGVRSMFKKLDSENDGHVKEGYMPTSDQPTDANKKTADKVRALFAKEKKTVKEELGKSNEWGTDSLRKKFAAMTPGQEGLTAKKIPTFDARYDDVPTQYCGGIQNEDTLSEVSAKGIVARDDFRKKIQKAMTDPANIARAKKVLAKKKAQQKVADANAPKNLVHQLHKSQSINAKVKFYDGKEHEIAPNHHDKFMNKYHGLKSSIEKEALINRAHKSHAEFLKAIHEEWVDFSQEKPNIDSIAPANYPTPPMHDDMLDYNSDDRHDEYDEVAIENDVAAEIENSEWEDLVDYYDDEDLDYEDSDEDIAEGITPQGRLKKRFNMMRNKSRRNMARNLALKRVATPDRIKSRSVRAARNMVYSRVLRGRDRSSLSASEKTRLEAMVKRMAPTVGRLSIRLQQKERMIDRKRINNRNKRKKK